MGRVERTFELRVMQPGSTDTVDFVIDHDHFASLPRAAGSLVRVEEGRASNQAYTFEIVDAGGLITSRLGDVDGRLTYIGRVCDYYQATNGGPMVRVTSGRISALTDQLGTYLLELSDERYLERRTDFFTVGDTTQLYPAGPIYKFRRIPRVARQATGRIVDKTGDHTHWVIRDGGRLPPVSREWIRQDVISDEDPRRTDLAGNFEHLRFLQGTQPAAEIVQFGPDFNDDVTGWLDSIDDVTGLELHIWTAGASPLPIGAQFQDVRLSQQGAPPSEANPFHVGVSDPTHAYGYVGNAMAFVEKVYQGVGIRTDAAQFAILKADLSIPRQEWRLTDVPSGTLADWLERTVYGPSGIVPFINDRGEISPRKVRLPYGVDHTTLFEFNGDNCVILPEPTFAEPINRVRVDFEELDFPHFRPGLLGHGHGHEPEGDLGGDLIARKQLSEKLDHDNVALLGVNEIAYDLTGLATANEGRGPDPLDVTTIPFSLIPWVHAEAAKEVFDRHGDGSIKSSMVSHRRHPDGQGRTPEEDVQPGDVVRLNLSTFPNPATNARTGIRLVQIVGKRATERGVEFPFEDIGAALQPLPTPGVSIALNPTDPKHAVDVTLSGTTNATLEILINGAVARALTDQGSGTITVRGLPSGTLIGARAVGTLPGRVRSDWSTLATVTTQALAPPSVGTATVDGYTITLTFTNNEPGYRLQPLSAPAGGTLEPRPLALPPASTFYAFHLEAASTSYDVAVRAVDEFGGASPPALATATTASSAKATTEPRRVQVRQGRPVDAIGGDLPPEALWVGTGFELTWLNTELHAATLWEIATDLAFTNIVREQQVDPGVETAMFLDFPLDDVTRYFRARHTRRSHAASVFSEIVAARSTALLATVENDSFAGGYLTLVEPDDATVRAIVGTTDPDTERAYYEVRVNDSADPFAPVDENSKYVSRDGSAPAIGAFPFSGQLLDNADNPIPVTQGSVVTVHARFWNSIRGFGQSTFETIVIGQALGNIIDIIGAPWVAKEYLGSGPFLDEGDYYLDFIWVPGSLAQSFRLKSTGKTSDLFGIESFQYVSNDFASPHRVAKDDGVTPRLFDGASLHAVELTTYTGLNGSGSASAVRQIQLLDPHMEKGLTASQPGGQRITRPFLSGSGAVKIDTNGGTLKLAQQDAQNATSAAVDYAAGALATLVLTAPTALPVPPNLTSGDTLNLLVVTNGHALTLDPVIVGKVPPTGAQLLVYLGNFDGEIVAATSVVEL